MSRDAQHYLCLTMLFSLTATVCVVESFKFRDPFWLIIAALNLINVTMHFINFRRESRRRKG